MNWQPIETAPKDGTQVLLWAGRVSGAGVAYWSDINQGGWVSYFPWADRATYWMPLPEPPTQELAK